MSGRILNAECPCPLPRESGHVAPQEAPPRPSVHGSNWSFAHLSMIDLIMIELGLLPDTLSSLTDPRPESSPLA